MIEFIGVIILTFLLRVIPGMLRVRFSGADQAYHLLVADMIREGKFKYPQEQKGFQESGPCIIPVLYHYLLALLPKSTRERLTPFYGAVIDTVHVILIYFFTLYVMQQAEFSSLVSNPSLVAIIAALLFASSPALLYIGIGPRAYEATPRILGELFITLTLFSVAIFYWEGTWWAAFLSCIFGGLTLLTSRFSTQVLLFFSIILAILLRSPLLLLLPFLSIVAALILSKGHYKIVLIAHIKHVIFYKRFLSILPVHRRNSLTPFKDILTSVMNRKLRDFGKNCLYILHNNAIIILITRDMPIPLLAYFIIINFSYTISNDIPLFFTSWVATSFVIFVLISMKPLLFLGEAERYLEHSIPAQAILLSFFMLRTDTDPVINYLAIALLISSHLLFYIVTIVQLGIYRKTDSDNQRLKQELYDWFRVNNIQGKNILAGLSQLDMYLAYRTDNKVLFPVSSKWLESQVFGMLFEEYPYPNTDLKMLVEKYNLELIIVNKTVLEALTDKGWIYDLSPYAVIYENQLYSVYQTR